MFSTRDLAKRVTRATGEAVAAAVKDKRVVVVGGTAGLGRAIARAAQTRGARVLAVGRTRRDEDVEFLAADLSRMTEAVRVARELASQPVDYLVLTAGILAPATRTESAEGIELDMAVSALSRSVILEHCARSLKRGAQVFIMGMPGSGQRGDPTDLNAERRPYGGSAGEVPHLNTVAANEALVFHWARELKDQQVHVFGLNPGLIPTGIRDSVHGGGVVGWFLEGIIGLVGGTAEAYGERIVSLFASPELPDLSGTLFNSSGEPILPTPAFADPTYVASFVTGLQDLEKRALGAASASASSSTAPPSAAAAAAPADGAAGGGGAAGDL
jgi:NAD(P)-dependent dehydrogenase (short-subunit alcohol dehydrogenase family)